jgi:hypothetical protein
LRSSFLFGLQQVAEKWPSATFPSSFVVAAYSQLRLTPQDCLPEWQVKSAPEALHLALFEQLGKDDFFSNC